MSNVEAIKKALEGVTKAEAIGFINTAMRNWRHVPRVDADDLHDLARELQSFSDRRYSTTLEALQREKEELLAENGELRNIVSNCAAALLTGAFVSPKCSIDFMKGVPKEISSTVGKLRALASAGEEHHAE